MCMYIIIINNLAIGGLTPDYDQIFELLGEWLSAEKKISFQLTWQTISLQPLHIWHTSLTQHTVHLENRKALNICHLTNMHNFFPSLHNETPTTVK